MPPLQQGKSKETIAANIAELHRANTSKSPDKKRPNAQIVAIAYSVAKKSKGDK